LLPRKEVQEDLSTESETAICYELLLDSIFSVPSQSTTQACRPEHADEPVDALEDAWSHQPYSAKVT
jgi:hypothetical protein